MVELWILRSCKSVKARRFHYPLKRCCSIKSG